jgi:hypothetical protein
MSQPDLMTLLSGSRPVAPAALRERVRQISAQAAPSPRRITWRRAFVVVAPVAAAVIAAAALLPGSDRHTATVQAVQTVPFATDSTAGSVAASPTRNSANPGVMEKAAPPTVPTPSGKRLQDYSASLELRVANATAVSNTSNRALQIASSLGGYLTTVNVTTGDKEGYANLVLRIPVNRVQEAVRRLSALGTIVSENVSVQDVQSQVDSTNRLLGRLRARLAAWRALPQTETTVKHIDALTAQIRRLQINRASTIRTAQLATIHLQLTTNTPAPVVHHGHGPLHNLGVIFRWAGIGAVYALALGGPLAVLVVLGWLIVRAARRRREDKLLAR